MKKQVKKEGVGGVRRFFVGLAAGGAGIVRLSSVPIVHRWRVIFGKVRRGKFVVSQAKSPKNIPQGLKPSLFCAICGTAEAVPYQSCEFFRKL